MKIELAGYSFSNEPVSGLGMGRIFMTDEKTGEGTEIDELALRDLLQKFFAGAM